MPSRACAGSRRIPSRARVIAGPTTCASAECRRCDVLAGSRPGSQVPPPWRCRREVLGRSGIGDGDGLNLTGRPTGHRCEEVVQAARAIRRADQQEPAPPRLDTPGSVTVDANAAATRRRPFPGFQHRGTHLRGQRRPITDRTLDTSPGYGSGVAPHDGCRGMPAAGRCVALIMATTELTDTNFNDATTGKTVVIDSGPSGVVPADPSRQPSPALPTITTMWFSAKWTSTPIRPGAGLRRERDSDAGGYAQRSGVALGGGALNESALRSTIDKAIKGPKRMTFKF